jgi:hypothetical protein
MPPGMESYFRSFFMYISTSGPLFTIRNRFGIKVWARRDSNLHVTNYPFYAYECEGIQAQN